MAKFGLEAITIKGDLFDTRQLQRVITNSLNGGAKDIKVDFKVTTQTWKNRDSAGRFVESTKFDITKPDKFTRIIGTDSDKYHWVNAGTKPHVIRAKNAPSLVFNTRFRPKTRVRVIGSGAGSSGPPVARAKVVQHPGTDAREFDDTIAKKWQRLFPGIVQRAIAAELTRR